MVSIYSIYMLSQSSSAELPVHEHNVRIWFCCISFWNKVTFDLFDDKFDCLWKLSDIYQAFIFFRTLDCIFFYPLYVKFFIRNNCMLWGKLFNWFLFKNLTSAYYTQQIWLIIRDQTKSEITGQNLSCCFFLNPSRADPLYKKWSLGHDFEYILAR